MSAVLIRDGTPADGEGALAVWRAANEARRGGRPAAASQQARTHNHLQNPEVIMIVAEDGGRIVGMALGLPARENDGAGPPIPGLCHVAMVFVAPDRWAQGIGRQLVDAVLERARARGYARAQLWTHADNARAQRLYEGRAFARAGREKVDDAGELIWLFARPL